MYSAISLSNCLSPSVKITWTYPFFAEEMTRLQLLAVFIHTYEALFTVM